MDPISERRKYTYISPGEHKEIVKEALKEWLDDKFKEFGWWTFKGVLSAVLFVVAYLWLMAHGWSLDK
jgi:hypothetical protein